MVTLETAAAIPPLPILQQWTQVLPVSLARTYQQDRWPIKDRIVPQVVSSTPNATRTNFGLIRTSANTVASAQTMVMLGTTAAI